VSQDIPHGYEMDASQVAHPADDLRVDAMACGEAPEQSVLITKPSLALGEIYAQERVTFLQAESLS
jgi:hypothetical protein